MNGTTNHCKLCEQCERDMDLLRRECEQAEEVARQVELKASLVGEMLAACEALVKLAIEAEVTSDGEWGSNRTAEQLRLAGQLADEILVAEVVIAKAKGKDHDCREGNQEQ